MIVELTTTNVEILPELKAVNLTITPKFTSGGNIPTKTSQLENDSNFISDSEYSDVKAKAESALQELPDNLVIDADYVHTDNNLTNELALEIWKVAGKQDSTDIGLNTTNKNIVSAINEVRGLALEIPIGLVFATKEMLDLWLTDSENKASLKNAQNLYMIDTNTPDYWWDFSAQVYHEIETKIDLSGYLTSEQISLAYQPLKSVLELYVSQNEKDTWNGKQNTLTFSTNIESDKASTTKISAIKTFYDWAVGLFAPKANPIFSGITHNSTPTYTSYASLTADTVGDTRFQVVAGVRRFERCTVANAAKGSGTWVVDMTLDASGKITVLNRDYETLADNIRLVDSSGVAFRAIKVGNARFFQVGAGGGDITFTTENGSTINITKFHGNQFQISTAPYDLAPLPVGIFEVAILTQRVFNVLSAGDINHLMGKYQYQATSATADTVNDTRTSTQSGVKIEEICTVGNATKGGGMWKTTHRINAEGVLIPQQAAAAPAYVKGGMYFDTTLNKMRIGGATGWETIQSL